METLRIPRPGFVFLAAAALVVAAEILVTQTGALAARPELLGRAVTVDLLVVLPALWWWLGVRRSGAPPVTLVPVVVAAWWIAKALLPAESQAWLRTAAAVAPALEAGLLLYLGLRIRRIRRAYHGTTPGDPVLRLRAAVAEVLGAGAASRLLADEITTLRYLFRPPGLPVPRGTETFTTHRRSGWGAVVFALSLVGAVEVVAVHALVARWSHPAAWALTALSVYGILWLVADWRATRARPVTLGGGSLVVRAGLRWNASIPRGRVLEARAPSPAEEFREEDALSLAPLGPPALVLELSAPTEVEGPLGISRRVTKLGIPVDDPERMAARLGGGGDRPD
jgi:hypothetical protein